MAILTTANSSSAITQIKYTYYYSSLQKLYKNDQKQAELATKPSEFWLIKTTNYDRKRRCLTPKYIICKFQLDYTALVYRLWIGNGFVLKFWDRSRQNYKPTYI